MSPNSTLRIIAQADALHGLLTLCQFSRQGFHPHPSPLPEGEGILPSRAILTKLIQTRVADASDGANA